MNQPRGMHPKSLGRARGWLRPTQPPGPGAGRYGVGLFIVLGVLGAVVPLTGSVAEVGLFAAVSTPAFFLAGMLLGRSFRRAVAWGSLAAATTLAKPLTLSISVLVVPKYAAELGVVSLVNIVFFGAMPALAGAAYARPRYRGISIAALFGLQLSEGIVIGFGPGTALGAMAILALALAIGLPSLLTAASRVSLRAMAVPVLGALATAGAWFVALSSVMGRY
ncbi:MAG: hypothetical protein ACYDH5_00465 [Acidimicrobiales bacterium]